MTGQERYLASHAQSYGQVELSGATVNWWILKQSQPSGRRARRKCGAHGSAVPKRALRDANRTLGHEQAPAVRRHLRPSAGCALRRAARRRREPVQANTARTQLLLGHEPLPWAEWTAEFRTSFPIEIAALMEEITAGSSQSDHKQAIRERLRNIRELFRFTRYRPTPSGDKLIAPDGALGGEPRYGSGTSHSGGSDSSGSGNRTGRAGSIYALFLAEDGVPGQDVIDNNEPDVQWITVEEGTRTPGFLEDRQRNPCLSQTCCRSMETSEASPTWSTAGRTSTPKFRGRSET